MSYNDMDDQQGGTTFLLGFIAGSLLGAGLALMFAPRTGVEMRRDVAERAQRLSKRAAEEYDTASQRVADLADRGKDAYRTAAERAKDLADRGRLEAEHLADRAHKVVDEVQARAEAGVAQAKASIRDITEARS